MAITRAMCTSFKVEILQGVHDLENDVLKLALYTNLASLGPGTTAYTTSGECSGTNYTAGGKIVTNPTVTYTGTTAFMDCDNVVWESVSITTRGALLYNSSKTDKAIAVLSFGSDQTLLDNIFTVTMPTADAYNALIRIT